MTTKQEVYNKIVEVMNKENKEYMDVEIVTFQNQEDEYFEKIVSKFTFDIEDSYDEFFEKVIDNEKIVKEYETEEKLKKAFNSTKKQFKAYAEI